MSQRRIDMLSLEIRFHRDRFGPRYEIGRGCATDRPKFLVEKMPEITYIALLAFRPEGNVL